MKKICGILLFSLLSACCCGQIVLQNGMHHLRNGQDREWSEFPKEAKGKELSIQFSANANTSQQTLSLQQYDVKQNWRILLNDLDIGGLVADEKRMKVYFTIPVGSLRDGSNTLVIKCKDTPSDDIMVGGIEMHSQTSDTVLSDASIDLQVIEVNTNK